MEVEWVLVVKVGTEAKEVALVASKGTVKAMEDRKATEGLKATAAHSRAMVVRNKVMVVLSNTVALHNKDTEDLPNRGTEADLARNKGMVGHNSKDTGHLHNNR